MHAARSPARQAASASVCDAVLIHGVPQAVQEQKDRRLQSSESGHEGSRAPMGEDPYMVTQMGLDAGNPNIMPGAGRMMRRMTVRRQWHWDKGSGKCPSPPPFDVCAVDVASHARGFAALTGKPGFIAAGMVPPKVPILGNAGMKMPIK